MASIGRQIAAGVRNSARLALGLIAVAALKSTRIISPDFMSNIMGPFMRFCGPWLAEQKVGRDNLTAAFPEKSPEEIERILAGVWDNLGRVGAEFAHIDKLWDYDITHKQPPGRILDSDESEKIVLRLRDGGKPAVIFSAHLANWELAAVAASNYGLKTAVLFRKPNLPKISDMVVKIRTGCMGTLIPTGLDAPIKLAEALERGQHVAMLVDQYYKRGVPVTFFGRRTLANPLLARLVRNVECPIHGIRVVRHSGTRFQLKMTEAIEPARDAEGKIDVQGTMQIVTSVIEGWVREHPEQWLWLHRRWRGDQPAPPSAEAVSGRS